MPLVVYTLVRLALIAVVWVVLWLAGLSWPIAFAAAILIGLMVAYLAFRGPRDAAARWLADRAARRRAAKGPRASGIEDDADVEDRAIDAAAASGQDAAPAPVPPTARAPPTIGRNVTG
ncbi:hypothetical protein GCM10025864_06000 [Luteimicrobium album]|uniref:DUF4229 domain-containing protein n=1 Tax=Luteimicrobium album TaxID=1054550 RepID=A0ABQ6HWJ0_9MICO|nr:DUF4229 domain-containing protein [Luteimicrobium album]GMA22841.1 hypothetical protein GCM10025864_06000 [Luteimicrobium album]